MAILSTLLSISRPVGFWENIIWAFDGFTNNYIWAVVLITIIIRIIWTPLDTLSRYFQNKSAKVNAKLQPEIEKLQAKYANDKATLNQKTNELYKRNNSSMMGGCGIMLVSLVFNILVFFTLFSGLNTIAAFKIYENYTYLKENYANCVNLISQNEDDFVSQVNKKFSSLGVDAAPRDAAKGFVFVVIPKDGETPQQIALFDKDDLEGKPLYHTDYLTLDQMEERDTIDESIEGDKKTANDIIVPWINGLSEKIVITIPASEEQEEITFTLLDATTAAASSRIEDEYLLRQNKFLWIQNIWVSDSPFEYSIMDYDRFAGQTRGYQEKDEDKVYNAFMPTLTANQNMTNGYLLLPLLCVLSAFLTSYISQAFTNRKEKKKAKMIIGEDKKKVAQPKQGKIMMIIMPIIMGVFALLSNSVFSVYLFVSQLVSTLLLPLQTIIIEKIEDRKEKKKLQQASDVDYRRKD